MKRLTTEDHELIGCHGCEEKGVCYARYWCVEKKKALIELKRYEDTGLTPAEIQELKERDTVMEINEIHVDEYFCPACGAENNCDQGVVEDNFCPRCGQRLKVRED